MSSTTSTTKTAAGVVLRVGLVIGLGYCGYLAGRGGISAWYMRQSSPEALDRAIAWDAGNPQNYDDLGTVTHTYGEGAEAEKIVAAYQSATRLSPQNAHYWADLGAAYDWAGRQQEALAAFHRAEELFPNSPDIHWRVANFCVRTGRTEEGLQSLKKVLAGGSVPRRDVFALAARATRDDRKILDEVLPADGAIYVEYLNFQSGRGDLEAASQAWRQMLELNLPFAMRDGFPYLDALIKGRKLADASETWALLGRRFPAEAGGAVADAAVGDGDELVTNGSFERDVLNGGFDWRIVPGKGANVSIDRENRFEGARSLRIDFDGTENVYFWNVYQYVRVKPETRYHFAAQVRVDGITTESGPTFEIYDAYNANKLFVTRDGPVGTSSWAPQEFDFKTKGDTKLLIVRVARRPSRKIANQIVGTAWVDVVSLKAVPGSGSR